MYEQKIHNKPWKRAEDSQKCVRAERLQNSPPCGSAKRGDAFVQPVVEDPVDADRVPFETGAEPVPIPCEPSESEKPVDTKEAPGTSSGRGEKRTETQENVPVKKRLTMK